MNQQAIKQAAEQLYKDMRITENMVSSLDDPAEVLREALIYLADFARALADATEEVRSDLDHNLVRETARVTDESHDPGGEEVRS